MRKKAFGAIDLLVSLVVASAIFLLIANSMKGVSVLNKPADTRSIQEHIDDTVNDIEQMRIQSIEIQEDLIR
jgi:hypothetical protein